MLSGLSACRAGAVGLCVAASTFAAAPSPPTPDHVVVLILENRSFTQVIGGNLAPYLNWLAESGATFNNFYALTHPSQPNYFEFFSGSNQGIPTNANPAPGSPFNTPNLASALQLAGKTFTAYSESLPTVGYAGASYAYYSRLVNPAVNWQSSSPGPNQLLPALNRPLSTLPADYAQLPHVSFVVPTLANSMHNNSVASGDAWVQANIGPYATWAMANNSLLIVTFDEDDSASRNRIPTIFYGPMVRIGAVNSTWTHHNLLRTLCDMYGATPPGAAAIATPIVGAFASDHLAEARIFRQGDGSYTGVHDTYIDPGSPTTARNTSLTLLTGGSGRQALVRFENIFGAGPDQVPPGATILSAKLSLLVGPNGGDASQSVFTAHRMLVPWADNSTWNSLGAGISTDGSEAASTPEYQVIPSVLTAPALFDVTSTVQSWSDGTLANNGFVIQSAGNDATNFRSSEAGVVGDHPTLEILYDAGPPCITVNTPPYSHSVVRGQPTSFYTTATADGPVSYQWYFNGQPLTDGNGITGTDTPTLTLDTTTFSSAGSYRARLSAPCGVADSPVASLTVTCDIIPVVVSHPSDVQCNDSQPVVISAVVTAPGPLTFQWQHSNDDKFHPIQDGGQISGAHTPTLTIARAGPGDEGSYRLQILSECAAAFTNSASLSVICRSDIDANGFVNGDDFDTFMYAFFWGTQTADYDHNEFVNGDDFDAFAEDFTFGC